ncbi:hypothetical protein ACGFZQ_28225 [Streptomyces sp. NPDC048254]
MTEEEVLRAAGVTGLSGHRVAEREEDLDLGFFLPDAPLPHSCRQ